MIQGKHILAVIPARGGSKGIPKKNIYKILGKPLIQYTLETLVECDWIDEFVVSTDDIEIMNVVRKAGFEIYFRRPASLAGDSVPDMPVLRHALIQSEIFFELNFDVIVMLQPTNPLRKPDDVRATVELLMDRELDAAWTVSETELRYHPDKQLRIESDGLLEHYTDKGRFVTARQQLNPTYYRNGNTYAFTRSSILTSQGTLCAKTGAVVLTDPQVNIDSMSDISYAEEIIRKTKV